METEKIDLDVVWMFAVLKHGEQMYGDLPYVEHLKDVFNLSKKLGYGKDIQISCILHDVIEDTDTTYDEVKNNFNKEIADIVYCVTDEDGNDRNERKAKTYNKIKTNWKSIVVKLCDRICNIEKSITLDIKDKYYMYLYEQNCLFNSLINDNQNKKELPVWILLGQYCGLGNDISYKVFIDNLSNTLVIT